MITFKQYYEELNQYLAEQQYPDHCFISEKDAKKYYELEIFDYQKAWELIDENGDYFLE